MAVLVGVTSVVACTSGDGSDSAEVSPSVEASPSAAASVVATVGTKTGTPEATRPYRIAFARGEPINVDPAVVFANLETGEAEAWVIPGIRSEFAVSPAGHYVVYETEAGFKLLRTDDGAVHSLGIGALPVEFGPGDTGFIAVDQDRFMLSTYDGQGQPAQNLWRSAPDDPAVASWTADGSIAVAQNTTGTQVSVGVLAAPGLNPQPFGEGFQADVPAGSPVSLEWSPDSELVAVVTSDAVYALDRDNDQVWVVAGEFFGNPRWSSDGTYLTVNAMPPVIGRGGTEVGVGTVTYLIGGDGSEVLRVTGAGNCGTDPWVDAGSFTVGRYLVTVDGQIASYDGRSPESWYPPEDFGVALAPGLGFHVPHIATRTPGQFLEDGRLVFTTPEVGHGGCGEGVSASEWPSIAIEHPPYGPLRSGLAVAAERLADQPDVLRVLEVMLDAGNSDQVERVLDLVERQPAPCSSYGELVDTCERAGLGLTDSYPSVDLGIAVCEGCYPSLEVARNQLAPILSGTTLQLEAIWELGPRGPWPFGSLVGRGFALWFVRDDWQRAKAGDPVGVTLLIVPDGARPISAIEVSSSVGGGYEWAAYGKWEPLYLATPPEPAP